MHSHRPISRRQLLTSGAAVSIPAIIPSHVLANPRKGRLGANDRIVIANIGVGGQGSNHIPPDSAALCDVDDSRLASARKRVTQGEPMMVKDFRRILDRKDIDAVTIGTPDHWHALMTVMACQAGKHVYSEKPTCRTIEEGRAMVNAARRYNRVVQIGAQGRSHVNAIAAARYIRNGMIGNVSRVVIWHPDNPTNADRGEPRTPPPGVDWDMWLGPARPTPYSPALHPANFRWFMDFGGGQIRDRGNHAFNMVYFMLQKDDYRGLITCGAKGDPQVSGTYDVPLRYEVKYRFYDPDWTLTWSQPGIPKMDGLWGQTYYGDKDSLTVVKGDGNCETEEKAKRFTVPTGGYDVYSYPDEAMETTARHRANWMDCIRTGKRPVVDVETGVRTCHLCILANLSWQLGRKLTFDAATERFVNDDEANRLISAPYRAPWKL